MAAGTQISERISMCKVETKFFNKGSQIGQGKHSYQEYPNSIYRAISKWITSYTEQFVWINGYSSI